MDELIAAVEARLLELAANKNTTIGGETIGNTMNQWANALFILERVRQLRVTPTPPE